MSVKRKDFGAMEDMLDNHTSDRPSILSGASSAPDKPVSGKGSMPQRRNKRAVMTAAEKEARRPIQVFVTPEDLQQIKINCIMKQVTQQEYLYDILKRAIKK